MINLQELRKHARTLLAKGEVRAVVGYRRGSRGAAAEPALFTDPAETDSMVWDPTCFHNLALYLVEDRRRLARSGQQPSAPIAIIAKGCDARALVVLLQENYFQRDQIYIMGVSCEGTGMLDERKLERSGLGLIKEATFADDKFALSIGEELKQVEAKSIMADRCLECRSPFPKLNNVAFGTEYKRQLAAPFAALTRFEESTSSAEARWQFWSRQFDRCIRCFACRAVCPMCYCEECIVDSVRLAVDVRTTSAEKANRVRWIERSATRPDNAGYHMTRALHLAGRCIDCGECERVCPVNIPLRLLNTRLEREVRSTFSYDPGGSVELASFVSSFRDNDPGTFIR